jgi:hypothetical protein
MSENNNCNHSNYKTTFCPECGLYLLQRSSSELVNTDVIDKLIEECDKKIKDVEKTNQSTLDDENGFIKVGHRVEDGDVIIGKFVPIGTMTNNVIDSYDQNMKYESIKYIDNDNKPTYATTDLQDIYKEEANKEEAKLIEDMKAILSIGSKDEYFHNDHELNEMLFPKLYNVIESDLLKDKYQDEIFLYEPENGDLCTMSMFKKQRPDFFGFVSEEFVKNTFLSFIVGTVGTRHKNIIIITSSSYSWIKDNGRYLAKYLFDMFYEYVLPKINKVKESNLPLAIKVNLYTTLHEYYEQLCID